jgi:hypothetical protein
MVFLQNANGQLIALPANSAHFAAPGQKLTLVQSNLVHVLPPRASSAPPTEQMNGNAAGGGGQRHLVVTSNSNGGTTVTAAQRPASVDNTSVRLEMLSPSSPGNKSNNVVKYEFQLPQQQQQQLPQVIRPVHVQQVQVPLQQQQVQQLLQQQQQRQGHLLQPKVIQVQLSQSAEQAKSKTSMSSSSSSILPRPNKPGNKMMLKSYGVPLLPKPPSSSSSGDGGSSGQNPVACNVKAMIMCQKCGNYSHHDCMDPSKVCVTCLMIR